MHINMYVVCVYAVCVYAVCVLFSCNIVFINKSKGEHLTIVMRFFININIIKQKYI